MKKIKLFSLVAATLFAGSTMAAATNYIPQGVQEVTANTVVYAADVPLGNNYTPASHWMGCPSTSSVSESGKTYTNVTSNTTGGNPNGLTDNIANATSVTMYKLSTSTNVYNSNKKVIHMHVKGISEIIVHGMTTSKGRGMAIGYNEVTNELTESTTIPESASVLYDSNNQGSFIVNLADLDATKEYVISVWAVGGDAYFYAAELIAGVKTPTLTSFTINEVEATIDDDAKTITAVLPYGTTIDWESVAVELGGSATQWSINDEHTTLTISNADASQKVVYTLNITVDATVSHDATLSDITLDGESLADFDTNTKVYTVELAYIAAVPAIEATPTNAAANVVVNAPTLAKGETGDATITVTAQDGTTQEVYTIHFTRAAAEVAKLYEVIFSNNAKGAIDADKKTVTVPYLADAEEAVMPTTEEKYITVQGAGATAVVNENNEIVMTSADDTETVFTIVGAPLVPKELGNETVTFDGSEEYFFAPAGYANTESKPYGWVANKNEESDKPRITAGLCRMYIALPACTSATVVTGTKDDRKAQLYVNSIDKGEVTFKGNNSTTIENLNSTSANFIGIENHGSGDLGFVNITLTGAKEVETAVEQAQTEVKAQKVIRNGQLLIIRDGKTYTAQGVQLQ